MILLDTHALVWWESDDRQIGENDCAQSMSSSVGATQW